VISQDLDELFEIAGRIAVLHDGTLSPAVPAAETTRETLGLLMGGAEPAPAAPPVAITPDLAREPSHAH
jgi:simple sugar transport system ATP-binding protein